MRVVDHLREETAQLQRRLRRLEVQGYDDTELGGVARDAAALWESSLKLAMGGSRAGNLNDLAVELAGLGWPASDALHVVRKAANRDKHEPTARHDGDALSGALVSLSDAADELLTLTAGGSAQIPERARRRRMICAIYDYFHTGDTDYSFLVADPEATWRSVGHIDSFEVDNSRSAEIEAKLAELDGWTFDPAEFGELSKSLRESDAELWRIAVFTASYQDVLNIMELHQHNKDLLPGLHRDDQAYALVASSVRGFIQGRGEVGSGRSPERAQAIQSKVDAVLRGLPASLRPLQLDRCTATRFAELERDAIVVDRALGLLVTARGVVYVLG